MTTNRPRPVPLGTIGSLDPLGPARPRSIAVRYVTLSSTLL